MTLLLRNTNRPSGHKSRCTKRLVVDGTYLGSSWTVDGRAEQRGRRRRGTGGDQEPEVGGK